MQMRHTYKSPSIGDDDDDDDDIRSINSNNVLFCFMYLFRYQTSRFWLFGFFFILSVLNVIIMTLKTRRIKNVSFFVKDYHLSRRRTHCLRRSSASVPGSQYGIFFGQSDTGAAFVPNIRGALSVIIPSVVFSHITVCDDV